MKEQVTKLTKDMAELTEDVGKIKDLVKVETNIPTLPELMNELEISVKSLGGMSSLLQVNGTIGAISEEDFQHLVFRLTSKLIENMDNLCTVLQK